MSVGGSREVAHRLFAAEFEDATFSYSESDEERAPNYVVTPTGARVNRLFAVGVLTEVAQAGDSILRARVVDPTGAFVVYAGQYQPEAMAFLENADTPAFVAVTGKARTFQPEDSDLVYTSVRPESIAEVDAATRDRWTVTTAERTLERIGTMAAAMATGQSGDALRESLSTSGVDASLAAGVPIALREYGTTEGYLDALQTLALDSLRLVAGEVDQVGDLSLAPGEGAGSLTPAHAVAVTAAATSEPAADEPTAATTEDTGAAAPEPEETEPEPAAASADPESEPDSVATEEPEPESEPATPAEEPSAETTSAPETTTTASSDDEPTEADTTAEPEEFDIDDETRQEVEEEYGLDFETGNEVGEAGAAGIEPETEPPAEPVDDDEPSFEPVEEEPETVVENEPETDPEAPAPAADDAETEEVAAEEPASDPAEDVDLDDVLMAEMKALDDGDGAEHDDLVAAVVAETGAAEADVEEAIQSALMSGQCYEPDDGMLQAI